MNKHATSLAFALAAAALAACGGGTTTGQAPVPVSGSPAPGNPTATPNPGSPTATPAPGSPTATPAPGSPTATPTPRATGTATPGGSPTAAATARPPEVERTILPTTTDINANDPDLPHLVVNPDPSVTPKNQLFVLLPGTDAYPTDYTYVTLEAAAQGYHAIGLEYPNLVEVDVLCEEGMPSCFDDIHLETATGQDASPLVVVTPANSIHHRLIALLQYLSTTYPTEGWGQYLTASGDVAWGSVVLSGHSQGGGHAGYIAKELYAVARLCFFSSPDDQNSTYGDATWETDATYVTPSSKYRGFINTGDTVEKPPDVYAIWKILGLGSSEVSVDTTNPPYGGSHALVTSHPPADTGDPIGTHDEPVLDLSTPVVNGVPLHKPTWDYNCFTDT